MLGDLIEDLHFHEHPDYAHFCHLNRGQAPIRSCGLEGFNLCRMLKWRLVRCLDSIDDLPGGIGDSLTKEQTMLAG